MTGPHDPNHDDPEPVPTVLPVFKGKSLSFTGFPESTYVKVVLPHAWGAVIDPVQGVLVGHLVRTDMPRFGPHGLVGAAARGAFGLKLLDGKEGG